MGFESHTKYSQMLLKSLRPEPWKDKDVIIRTEGIIDTLNWLSINTLIMNYSAAKINKCKAHSMFHERPLICKVNIKSREPELLYDNFKFGKI